MEKSLDPNYRSRLLQRALEEKKKLGLDESHGKKSNVKLSSALQALQCYGHEHNDATSPCEIEETVYGSHGNERHKTGDLPKQTKVSSSSTELQLITFGSSSAKDDKPLKSILKKNESPTGRFAAGNKPLPCNSNINMPFFLNNAENEDEFLYGKSVNEQLLRVGILNAKNKRDRQNKMIAIDSNTRNLKTCVGLPRINDKNVECHISSPADNESVSTQGCSGNSKTKCSAARFNSKASSNLSGYAALVNFSSAKDSLSPSSNNINKDTARDLLAQDSKEAACLSGGSKESSRVSADFSGNSRSKDVVASFNVKSPKVSSDMSRYAALLSFSNSGRTSTPLKVKNVLSSESSKKGDETCRENKTDSHAVSRDDLTLHGMNSFKSPTTSSTVRNSSSKTNSISANKQVTNLLPRSVQKLQMNNSVNRSVDKKDISSGTETEKGLEVLHSSASSDSLKSAKKKKCDDDVKPEPKNVETSLKKDELMLLTYIKNKRNIPRAKIKSDQITKPVLSGSLTNSDCKSVVKTVVEKSASLDKETKCSSTVVPGPCIIENTKAVTNNASAAKTAGNSSELKNKCGFATESMASPIKPGSTTMLSEIPPISKMCKNGTGFPNKKKEFLSKLSSIKHKKNNFFYQGKKSFHKDFYSKRPLKRPKGLFVHEKVHGQIISKGGKYSKVNHFFNSNSEKAAHAKSDIRSLGEETKYSLSPENDASDNRGFNSFDSRKTSGNSSDHNNKRDFMLLRSDEILGSDSNLTSFSEGRHKTTSALRPKRHSYYVRHGYAISGRSPQSYSHKSSSPSHSLDWSPLRDELDNGSRRCSMDLSPPRYSFDVSPKRQQHLDRSPSRHSFKESGELYPSDKSYSPRSFSRSPLPYSYDRSHSVSPFRTHYSHSDRSPGPDPYDDISSRSSTYAWSPDPHLSQRKCDSDPYDRSPDRNSYSRSPIPLPHGGSSLSRDCVRSPSPHYYGRDQDLSSHNQISGHNSRNGSPAPELCGKSSGIYSQEVSLKRYSHHKEHEMRSFENSHVRHAVEISPTRLSDDRTSERISVDRSVRKLSHDRSLKKFSANGSHRMHSSELNPRKLPSGREPRKKSSDISSRRFRKSRIDSYCESSDGMYRKSLHKESCKNLKHSLSSTESVTFDSSNRFTERNAESNLSDSSQHLSSGMTKRSEQLNSVKPFGENCTESMVEKISQHQKQHNIKENLIIPDVNKIVNAIDALASTYKKDIIANEKQHNIAEGFSSQSFDSALNIKDPVHTQLNVAPGTYTSAYGQSCYNPAVNSSQFMYNSEFSQMAYPPYSVSPVNSCLPNYMQSSFSSQSPDGVTPYQAKNSDFHSIFPASTPYSDSRVTANVEASLSGVPDACGVSSSFCDVYTSSPYSLMQKPCSATNELSGIFPADQSNGIASDDSHQRVATLTTVPLQSNVLSDELDEKNSSKYQNSIRSAVTTKFITPDKIEKLLTQKSEIRKQISCLNDECEKLLKMQGNALRRKQREKDGHKDLLLLEYGKLQDEIKSHVHSLVGDIEAIEQELKNGFLGCTSDNENGKEPKKSGECNEQGEDPSDYFEFYDSGSHWCKHCNKLCTTITGMLEHVKSDEHLEHIREIEKPWYSSPTTKKPTGNKQKGQKITKPIKGIQFVMPVDGFFCSLCKEYFQKKTDMQEHLESLAHFKIYQNYTAENPTYERKWLMEKLAGLSFVEIEDRAMENKPLQKKQRNENLEWGKGEKTRWEEEERFIQGREEQFRQKQQLLQTVEERMDAKEMMKHKVKKKYSEEEEEQMNENFQLTMDMVQKLDHRKEEKQGSKYREEEKQGSKYRKEEKQGSKYSKEHGKEGKHKEKDEENLMSCPQEDTLKRKKGKEIETSNKIRILSCAQEAEKSDEKLESRGAADNFTVEKQSDPEAKWTVCKQQKQLPLKKSSEPKSKPKQTVVYIGRAPNFKSHNKGNSSFRANLLKLALQKKEADMNLNSAMTSTETAISCVSNVSSPIVTSTPSEIVQHSHSTDVGSTTDAVGNNTVNTCTPLSSGREVKQQIHCQSSTENITNSGLQSNSSVSVLSTLEGVACASATDSHHKSLTCEPNHKSTIASNTTRSGFARSSRSFRSVGSRPQENCDVTAANTKHAKVSDYIQGPLTEEENDYRILGIDREDTVPLVIPKPPPLALIWPCYKDGKEVSGETFCTKAATMTSNSDAPKHHSVNSDIHSVSSTQVSAESCSVGIHNPITITASTVQNSNNLLDSQRSFSFTYGVNTGQQQNVSYSKNVQSKISASFAPVNGTRTSSVQQSYTYPYSSNTYGFQENFVGHDENNSMSYFPAAQVPPPMQFQGMAPQMRYSCQQAPPSEYYNQKPSNFYAGRYPQKFQGMAPQTRYSCQRAPPPEYYNQKPTNFYAGRYPQNQLPSPNVNPHQNYAPVFQGSKRFHAPMFRGSFKNKGWHPQRKMQPRPNTDTKKKEELIPQVKTEEQVLDNTENEKLVSCNAANIKGCAVDDLSEGNVPKTDSSSDTDATFRLESVEISNTVGDMQREKSFPIESQSDVSNCIKSSKGNADSEENQVPPEDVAVTDCGVASVYSNKRNSVADMNNSRQPCEATTAEFCNSDTAFVTSLSDNFYDTSKQCENTLGGTNVKVDQGASQQNHPSELKTYEGTPSLESECDRSTSGES